MFSMVLIVSSLLVFNGRRVLMLVNMVDFGRNRMFDIV